MAAIEPNGFTLKEMVTEIRLDLKEVKADVADLKEDKVARDAAKGDLGQRLDMRYKVFGAVFVVITTLLNVAALGPDIINSFGLDTPTAIIQRLEKP